MSEKDKVDAVLRVVSNKCRNLRKVIDRARALETAQAEGQTLNEEQRESVKGLARKEALLVELQEILKKQTAVANPPEPEASKVSRRAAKAARAKAKEKETEEPKAEKGEEEKHDTEATDQNGESTATEKSNGTAKENEGAGEGSATKDTRAEEILMKQLSELKLSQEQRLIHETREAVRKTLNLFHVVDFLRQEGSREALFGYYDSLRTEQTGRPLTNLDLDLLCYFNIMLTSPNGNVPHPEAVAVSAAHCLEFLKASAADAFEGTSYAMLASIVDRVASCPILTDRGEDIEIGNDEELETNDVIISKVQAVGNTRVGSTVPKHEPSYIVDDPVADGDKA